MVTIDLLSELRENLKPEAKPGWGVTLSESPRESGTWGTEPSLRSWEGYIVCVQVFTGVHVHVCMGALGARVYMCAYACVRCMYVCV